MTTDTCSRPGQPRRRLPRRALRLLVPLALAVVSALVLVAGACGDTQPLVVPPPETASPTASPTAPPPLSYQSTAAFWSNGDLISGWQWLRDEAGEQYATWTIESAYEGASGTVLDLTLLATDTFDGEAGHAARFYLSWGALSGDGTVDFGPALLVKLPNTSAPDDPVGYTCSGMQGIGFPPLSDGRRLVVRITRRDPDGGAAIAEHIAVNADSVKALWGE